LSFVKQSNVKESLFLAQYLSKHRNDHDAQCGMSTPSIDSISNVVQESKIEIQRESKDFVLVHFICTAFSYFIRQLSGFILMIL